MNDISGHIFDRLTALYFDYKSPSKKYFWKCKCQCGNIVSYRSDALKSGRRKSCGCIKSPYSKEYTTKIKKRLLDNSIVVNDCREWKGRLSPSGYGIFKLRVKEIEGLSNAKPKRNQFSLGVHRVAYKIWKGEIPKGFFVLHRCDNRLCINPNHLFLGTHQENMNDMVLKNRQDKRTGEKHHITKFSDDDIKKMRKQYQQENITQADLCRKYKVSSACICNIVNRKTWKHI